MGEYNELRSDEKNGERKMIFPTTDTELNTARVLSVKLSFPTLTKAMRTARNARKTSPSVHVIRSV